MSHTILLIFFCQFVYKLLEKKKKKKSCLVSLEFQCFCMALKWEEMGYFKDFCGTCENRVCNILPQVDK